jgi:hypothetical protein
MYQVRTVHEVAVELGRGLGDALPR